MVQTTETGEQSLQGGQSNLECPPDTKWAALIDDLNTPAPQQIVKVSVLKAQAAIGDEFVLVQDHNSPNDVVLDDNDEVDLAAGNVFYRLSRCDVRPRGKCTSPPKLAYFVDDRAEITTNPNQTGQTLRGLFSLAPQMRLVRDLESPNDDSIEPAESARFADGPVFYTREVESGLKITVNHRVFTEDDGVTEVMKGLAVASLVYPENPQDTSVRLGDREIGLDEEIHIEGCEAFDVIRCNVKGGYELSRIEREIEQLREGGASVTVVETPAPAVVYHSLKTRPGCDPAATDVLVPIPGGYPCKIDWAYLPESSPLIGRVEGSPQDHRVTALDRKWQQISYHPHDGGGGPAFDPTKHGFHTYIGELLSWLYKVR
ncbi:MAG: hypothetical protein HQ518_32330 [Rhodopirellula sp.]|nr:hypothetical protein [Rhodopirellula sp.]